MTPETDVHAAIEEAHRRDWGRVLATTMRLTRDLDLAEDCVEEAYVSALSAWQRDGIPASPVAWLTTAARRRALDVIRRATTLRSKYPLIAVPDAEGEITVNEPDEIPDERLRLIFTCCHPALARENQVALTLRMLCGLETSEIARMFLVPQPTIAARITRAKKKIAAANIPYRIPNAAELPERLESVLAVIHLIYSTGHTSPEGESLDNPVLIERALDLARSLVALMPDEREARGLLAMIMLNEARRGTRTDAAGDLVLLEKQDRSRWDQRMIREGQALTVTALTGGRPGKYALQAAIAAVHAGAESWAATDWAEIVGLYDALLAIWSTPVVALNRIAAVSMALGPEVALTQLKQIEEDERLRGYPYLPATRADLLRRLGRMPDAAESYRAAIALNPNARERIYLERRLAEVIANSG